MSDNTEALREALQRIVDWDAAGLALTADHIAQARAALAQQAATPAPDDDDVLTVAYMVGRYDGRKDAAAPATPAAPPAVTDAEAMAVILAHAVPGVAVAPDPRAVELGLTPAAQAGDALPQLTDEQIEFGLNCNLEDPSDDEAAGFYAGARFAMAALAALKGQPEGLA
jgi:hypothetical protein